jgi:hypothetical protein
MLAACRTTSIFPNLQQLHLNLRQVADGCKIALFLGPHLRTLELEIQKDNNCLQNLTITTLSNAPPQPYEALTQLRIETISEDHASSLIPFVASLARIITDLRLGVVSLELLAHLSQLPNLKRLTFVGGSMPQHTICPASLKGGYPSLSYITAIATPLCFCTLFLELIPSRSEVVALRVTNTFGLPSTRPHEVESFLDVLMDRVSQDSLDELSLHLLSESGPSDDDKYPLRSAAVTRLVHFKNLTNLTLDIDCGTALDDDGLRALAIGLTRLVSLSLKKSPYTVQRHPPRPRATIVALSSFAENCSDLRFLTLEFDASIVIPYFNPRQRETSSKMEVLLITHSPIEDPLGVATFLSGMFPKLANIVCDSKRSSENAMWVKVQENLHTVRAELPN